MTDQDSAGGARTPAILKPVEAIGARVNELLRLIGSMTLLLLDASSWLGRGAASPQRVRIGRAAIISQINRLGVRSIVITSVVSGAVGMILALQLAPPLDEFGQKDRVANIIGVAVLRELGPLIGAIVMTGFAGAAIAAEIGTMVVGEEIEALEAHALNPIRFLVVPRVVATTLSMGALAVVSVVVCIFAAWAISVTAIGIPSSAFINNLLDQVSLSDFLTGWSKGFLFGLLIGVIACGNGLAVHGGAAGVGLATTMTVVQSVVAIVIADLMFTAMFYALGLF